MGDGKICKILLFKFENKNRFCDLIRAIEIFTRILYKIARKIRLIMVIMKTKKGEKMFKLVSDYKPTGDQPQAILCNCSK